MINEAVDDFDEIDDNKVKKQTMDQVSYNGGRKVPLKARRQ